MDHLGAMRAFVSVAKLGSFAEAARRLQLSPSVLAFALCSAGFSRFLGLDAVNRECRQPSLLVFRFAVAFPFEISNFEFEISFAGVHPPRRAFRLPHPSRHRQ